MGVYQGQWNSDVVFTPRPSDGFVETPRTRELVGRAFDYIRAGFPVHLSGATGVGKTTMALHIAAKIGRPAVMMHGDYDLESHDLVGGVWGYRRSKVVDNFIRSVMKSDESVNLARSDGRLVTACRNGFTLIYDEFTRSRPETNNLLLSVLEEGLLPLSGPGQHGSYVEVHPKFVAIFISNPTEYAGVQQAPNALLDRMATIEIRSLDETTEVAITQARSRVSPACARRIVEVVRGVREVDCGGLTSTLRPCILLGRLVRHKSIETHRDTAAFEQLCMDVLLPRVSGEDRKAAERAIRRTVRRRVAQGVVL